jgi:hypothetical protein
MTVRSISEDHATNHAWDSGLSSTVADIELTQEEADALIAMEKRCVDNAPYTFPAPGHRLAVPLVSLDRRENFMLDITRGQIKLTKATYQTRARQAIILLRLDLDGPPHRNPDDSLIPCPHLHVYREGYGDKWAVPAPPAIYSTPHDLIASFIAFMHQCNVVEPPQIQAGLFS